MENSQDLLDLINQIRKKKNTLPLILNSILTDAAGLHATYMLQNTLLSHTGRNNSSFDQRIKEAGYSFKAAAENVAFGAVTVQGVFNLWMNSPPHRENILNPVFTDIGIGLAPPFGERLKDNIRYWSTSFAQPSHSGHGRKAFSPKPRARPLSPRCLRSMIQ